MKSKTITNMYLLMAAVFVTTAFAIPATAGGLKMTISGTSAASTINLQQPNTHTGEDNFAGKGALGSFTYRFVHSMANNPTPSSVCTGPNDIHFSDPAGGGVFRFQDGSLLYVQMTQGDDCIDLVARAAHCIRILKITGGTGRFQNASGTFTLNETAIVPVVFDAFGNPVLFAAIGDITGTISGAAEEGDQDEDN